MIRSDGLFMRNIMNFRLSRLALSAFAMLIPHTGSAETKQYCVICDGPEQTYLCQVNTPSSSSGDKGLQLYCIIRVSKDGGHKSCAVRDVSSTVCEGPVRTYTLTDSAISPQLRSAAEKIQRSRSGAAGDQENPIEQKGGEPQTVIEMTGRAVKASRKGLKNTGQAVSGVASSTTRKVGNAARGAGKGVTKGAKKVGTATKKTGSAVSSAARTAYNCLKSWFKKCGSEPEKAPPASQ